jgi:hypothetical protein
MLGSDFTGVDKRHVAELRLYDMGMGGGLLEGFVAGEH